MCASPPITIYHVTNFQFTCFAISSSLGFDGDSSLVLEIEDAPCNCYKVDMGASPHEAPIEPCAYEIPSISSKKFKILHAKKCIVLVFPPLQTLNHHNIHHKLSLCKIPMLPWMFGPFRIINYNMNTMSPPFAWMCLYQNEMWEVIKM